MCVFHTSSLREELVLTPAEKGTRRRANRGVLWNPVIQASLYPKALSQDSSKKQKTKTRLPELAFCQGLFIGRSLKPASLLLSNIWEIRLPQGAAQKQSVPRDRVVIWDFYLDQPSPKDPRHTAGTKRKTQNWTPIWVSKDDHFECREVVVRLKTRERANRWAENMDLGYASVRANFPVGWGREERRKGGCCFPVTWLHYFFSNCICYWDKIHYFKVYNSGLPWWHSG